MFSVGKLGHYTFMLEGSFEHMYWHPTFTIKEQGCNEKKKKDIPLMKRASFLPKCPWVGHCIPTSVWLAVMEPYNKLNKRTATCSASHWLFSNADSNSTWKQNAKAKLCDAAGSKTVRRPYIMLLFVSCMLGKWSRRWKKEGGDVGPWVRKQDWVRLIVACRGQPLSSANIIIRFSIRLQPSDIECRQCCCFSYWPLLHQVQHVFAIQSGCKATRRLYLLVRSQNKS